MARLSTDSSLHLGVPEYDTLHAYPAALTSGSSSAVISPFVLPRGAMGYFDQPVRAPSQTHARQSITQAEQIQGWQSKTGSNHVQSPPAGAASPLIIRQPSDFLSPRLAPLTREAHHQLLQAHQQLATGLLSPPTPGDAASPPSQAQTIRRLIRQNGRIREAWEAERKYLEANRERAEEVYKEERGLMEEERAEWEAERECLLRQIASLQQQVAESARYPRLASTKINDGLLNGEGRPVSLMPPGPQGLRGGGNSDTSPGSARSPGTNTSQANAHPRQAQRNGLASGDSSRKSPPGACLSIADALASSTPPKLDFGKSDWSRFAPPSITRRMESSSFTPFANNIFSPGPEPNATSGKEDMGPVPTVDVQEVIPTLEGIPLKAAAIQKHTFTDANGDGSANVSPPLLGKSSSQSPSPPTDQPRPGVSKRASKQQTLQVLAADVTERLTMHAGHTPSHSLSVLPTVTASIVTTASSSGTSTPTLQPCDGPDTDVSTEPEPSEPVPSMVGQHPAHQGHPEPMLEPDDDIELKGPLMVRNMPAHDEIFFQKLSDKLEEVSRVSEAAVPAVLKDTLGSEEPPNETTAAKEQSGANDGREAVVDKERKSSNSSRASDEEMEIPLKIRKINNFGAPFGEVR